MKCGLNMAFANRQVILHRIREVFSEVFGRSAEDLGLRMVYDVSHNTAKLERHVIDGKEKTLLVHRKGATRAFGPGHHEVTARYRDIGQPVILGGRDRKSTRLNSSHSQISYAVFCLKKKNKVALTVYHS